MLKTNKTDILRFNTSIDETTIYNPLALVVKAKGSKIWIEGEEEPYFDLLMSYSSTNFGHVNPDIIKFTKESASKYDNIIAFNSVSKIELSRKLVELLPYPGNKIPYYPAGGAKAIDAAIKLAKAYTKKDTIIAFEGAFHGYSYAAMTVTDDGFVEKKQFGSYPGKIQKFPFPHRMVKNTDQIAKRILKSIEEYLNKNSQFVAAIIFEPIQGGAGFVIPPDNFLKELVKIANKVIDYIEEKDILNTVQKTGEFLFLELKNLMKNYPFIKELDHIGMAYSYRVESTSGKMEDNTILAKRIKKEAFKNHLIIQTAGVNVDRMKLAPNFFITNREIKDVLSKFKKVLDSISHDL